MTVETFGFSQNSSQCLLLALLNFFENAHMLQGINKARKQTSKEILLIIPGSMMDADHCNWANFCLPKLLLYGRKGRNWIPNTVRFLGLLYEISQQWKYIPSFLKICVLQAILSHFGGNIFFKKPSYKTPYKMHSSGTMCVCVCVFTVFI